MISAWHLLYIIPIAAAVGFLIAAAMVAAKELPNDRDQSL